jgi:hypothetical protein
VLPNLEDSTNGLIREHFALCVQISDPDGLDHHTDNRHSPKGSCLQYAALYGFHDLITFRVVECSQDVDASNFGYNTTLLRLALRYGHVEVTYLTSPAWRRCKCSGRTIVDSIALRVPERSCESCSEAPRGCESPGQSRVVDSIVSGGYVEVARVLLEHDADTNANARDDFLQVDKTHTHTFGIRRRMFGISPDASRKWHRHEIVPGIRVCTISRSIRATSTHPPAYAKCSGFDFFFFEISPRALDSFRRIAFGRTRRSRAYV